MLADVMVANLVVKKAQLLAELTVECLAVRTVALTAASWVDRLVV